MSCILNIDTSTDVCSVAVSFGGECVFTKEDHSGPNHAVKLGVVVDEALSVGDATFKKKCKNRIKHIINDGTTVLYVSHNAESVREICPRAIFLKKGTVIFDGPTEETLKIYQESKKKKK